MCIRDSDKTIFKGNKFFNPEKIYELAKSKAYLFSGVTIDWKAPKIGENNLNNVPKLYVSNHLSYLDIPVLGSTINGRFIAKYEISNWPIFGYLSKVGNTIFINRNLRFLKRNKSIIYDFISKGDSIILFPEGTTSDGIRVLKFKSSLLTSLEQKNILIQPIVINYTSINGMPLNRWLKPIIAWYGDMDLKPHLILSLIHISEPTRR